MAQDQTYKPTSRLVSAGVFTRELDQSFLAQGVANIGGVIVGPFSKGPGFTPTTVNSQADLETLFGTPDGTYYTPYCAQQYLEQNSSVTVLRVGQVGGYTQKNPAIIYAQSGTMDRVSGEGEFTSSIAQCKINKTGDGSITGSITATFVTGPLSGSLVSFKLTASFDTGSMDLDSGSGDFLDASLTYTFDESYKNYAGSVFTAYISASNVGSSKKYTVFGLISGSFGALIPSTFVENTEQKVVLAILANTANDRNQNLVGFTGSVLTPINSASIGSDFNLQLNQYNSDTETTSSYGTYRFSLDVGSPAYLTNVFGTDPTAGYIEVAEGQKIDAAYVYKYFPNTITEVLGNLLEKGNYQIKLADGDGIYFDEEIGDFLPDFSMKFNDGVPGGGGGVNNTAWSQYDLRQAETPWINSQRVSSWSGSVSQSIVRYNLFKIHTLSDGTYTNTEYKVTIKDVKLANTVPGSEFGTFTLEVRAFDDTDRRPVILERYVNLTLDPDSANYIARRIGDSYSSIDYNGKILEFGEYPTKSKFIRIEMTTAPYPKTSVPYGFDAYASPIGGDFANNIPKMVYTKASTYSKQIGKYSSGIIFHPAPIGADDELSAFYPNGTSEGVEEDNKQYFAPIPVGSQTSGGYLGNNTFFDLEDFCGISPIYNASIEDANVRKRNFTFGFQQGFDGGSPSIPKLLGDKIIPANTQGLDCSTILSSGSVAYKQSIAAISNPDEFDFNLLVTPGVIYNLHPYVIQLGLQTCEDRGDCFYVFDIFENQTAGGNSIENVVNVAKEFDTNYAATYYPWVKIRDTNTNKVITVPPSVVMPAVYASNDRVAAEWYAPAGLNRGGIEKAIGVQDRLTQNDRDTLYEGNVNPIAAFPGTGIVVWGQKTLQIQPSALDRINVRRLLIAVKKFIASSSKYLLWEQNNEVTRNKFLSIVNPYLESVVQRNGLYAFRVVMDATNNTADTIDRNQLIGQIYLQPQKSIEFILLDFSVLPTGATFPND